MHVRMYTYIYMYIHMHTMDYKPSYQRRFGCPGFGCGSASEVEKDTVVSFAMRDVQWRVQALALLEGITATSFGQLGFPGAVGPQ